MFLFLEEEKRGAWTPPAAIRNDQPDMADDDAPAPAKQTYSSPLMLERRRRILDEARALLGESGERGFSIRDLSRRANVSTRTLYSAYGDKEGILSAACVEYVEELSDRLALPSRSGQLPDILAEFDDIVAEVGRYPAYDRTLIELFYSMSPLKPALAAIRRLPADRLVRWLAATPRSALLPSINMEWATDHHVDAELAIFHHWAVGRLPINELAAGLKLNFVGGLLMITMGETRDELCERFAAMNGALVNKSASEPN